MKNLDIFKSKPYFWKYAQLYQIDVFNSQKFQSYH